MARLRKLTLEEIEKFASRPKVKKIAVENFLMTLTTNPNSESAYLNLDRDAAMYGWNVFTYKAIRDGIKLAEVV
jgi:hypothetical protein